MTASVPVVPVVMCTWRRPEYFHRTLRCLEAQHGVRVELHVWNNNPDIAAELERTAAGSAVPVRFHHSPENIGGFGRFHLARELAPTHPFVVFIDDDQLFGAHTIATLRREARPRNATGWWAYRFPLPPHYWLRLPVRKGHRAQYIGTCGMVIDASVFQDERVFSSARIASASWRTSGSATSRSTSRAGRFGARGRRSSSSPTRETSSPV